MRKVTASALLLSALAGCGGGGEQANTTSIEVSEGGYQARLQAMPEAARNATFIRAIRGAGLECQHVESSSFRGEINGAPTWQARCDDGVEWLILIGRDGTAQVINAAQAQQAGVTPAAANQAQP